jgi:hypothetical protein
MSTMSPTVGAGAYDGLTDTPARTQPCVALNVTRLSVGVWPVAAAIVIGGV